MFYIRSDRLRYDQRTIPGLPNLRPAGRIRPASAESGQELTELSGDQRDDTASRLFMPKHKSLFLFALLATLPVYSVKTSDLSNSTKVMLDHYYNACHMGGVSSCPFPAPAVSERSPGFRLGFSGPERVPLL
ncbi:hypothetical protein J6590_047245 [Homalodisca vitripennis]|nr:hypothetical protein J6590_047245 [Homalodisca vitripennis]